MIEVQGLSKRYQLGVIGATRLRDDLERCWHRLTGHAQRVPPEEFWALRDVSFTVAPGEVVGIIGRNGAGKSTLLKILSRITEPTDGEVLLRGRVASLLEVGTGFHPDLTGRENIYLNGAILGMKRAEITRQFDEIIAFAEVEQFIDTPVKRYSSGMYVRLAFAVAAHLEPEILIVDEVLAVGDVQFQKKCLGKMREISHRAGRTVLFVSHNMAAVCSLCQRAVLIDKGRLTSEGDTSTVVQTYLDSSINLQRSLREERSGIVSKVDMVSMAPDFSTEGWNIKFDVHLSERPRPDNIGIDFILRHNDEAFAFGGSAYFQSIEIPATSEVVRCVIGPLNLALGAYEIDVFVCDPMVGWLEEHSRVLQFSVERQLGSDRFFQLEANRSIGVVIPSQQWTVVKKRSAEPAGDLSYSGR